MKTLKIILIIFTFCSCSDNIDKERLIGQYVMVNDTIELSPNKIFTHRFNGKINCGMWTLNSFDNEIEFHNFSFSSNVGNGIWYSKIKLTNNEIHLMYNSDISQGYFNKIK